MRVKEKEQVRENWNNSSDRKQSGDGKVEGESRLLQEFKDGNLENAAVVRGNYSESMGLWSTMKLRGMERGSEKAKDRRWEDGHTAEGREIKSVSWVVFIFILLKSKVLPHRQKSFYVLNILEQSVYTTILKRNHDQDDVWLSKLLCIQPITAH